MAKPKQCKELITSRCALEHNHRGRCKRVTSPRQARFVRFLRETLIPDLRDMGMEYTADDFETCLRFMGED